MWIQNRGCGSLRDEVFPFYITESWRGTDIISVLYVGEDKEALEHIDLSGDNQLVLLGDYIDYGLKSGEARPSKARTCAIFCQRHGIRCGKAE